PEAPPDIPSRFPAGLVKRYGRDDAALAPCPRAAIGRLLSKLLAARVVRRVAHVRRAGEVWDQAPAADDELTLAVIPEAYKRARRPRQDLRWPGWSGGAPADLEEALDLGLIGADVA